MDTLDCRFSCGISGVSLEFYRGVEDRTIQLNREVDSIVTEEFMYLNTGTELKIINIGVPEFKYLVASYSANFFGTFQLIAVVQETVMLTFTRPNSKRDSRY